MKIVRNQPERIELRGVPAAGFALLGGVFVCPALAAGVGFFLWLELTRTGAKWHSLPVLVLCGAAVFIAFLWAVALAQVFRREWLVLDKVTGRGEHGTRWIFGGAGTMRTFELSRIRHVSLEFYSSRGGGRGMPVAQKRARLLLDKPRRAIVLEDSESGFDGRVEPVAAAVAAWLGMEVKRMGSED